ncbi:MAG: ATP-binding protein [Bacteroidales bacterium]|nr:ATP-binding protein [Bacteroidales bacterium]
MDRDKLCFAVNKYVGRKSAIITANLTSDQWNEIFGDTILTAAMADRPDFFILKLFPELCRVVR